MKITKNILYTSLCTILISGCANINHISSKKDLRTQDRKNKIKSITKHSSYLFQNRNDEILYITKKTEEEGIKDLITIVNSVPNEDSWIYLPEKRLWFEVGINQKSYAYSDGLYKSTSTRIPRIRNNIINQYGDISEIIIYHNHPIEANIAKDYMRLVSENKVIENDEAEETQKYIETLSDDYKSRDNNILNCAFTKFPRAKPSCKDIDTMISSTFNVAKTNKDIKLKAKICSEYGITTYFLTKKGKEKFQKDKNYSEECLIDAITTQDDKDAFILQSKYICIEFKPHENNL